MSLFIPLFTLILEGLTTSQVKLVVRLWGIQFECEVCDFQFEKKGTRVCEG